MGDQNEKNQGGGQNGNGSSNGGGHDKETGPDKDCTIIVNGTPKVVAKTDLTFEEVVALANLPHGSQVLYTVVYRRAHGNKNGSLTAGESVKVKEGMIFDVTATDKS